MKRDMDLVRDIILAARQSVPFSAISEIPKETFAYHVQILQEAGLLMAALSPDGKAPPQKAIVLRLTWASQDFADAIMDEGVWKKAKDDIIKPAASWTFGILLEYLAQQIKNGLPGFNG